MERALDAQGIEYERVFVETKPQEARTRVFELTGQYVVPTIEFEDGAGYRAESKEMAAEIRAGRLFDHAGSGGGPAGAG